MSEAMLKRALFDLFDLGDKVSEDIDYVDIGQDKEGRWIAWHVEYPEDGHECLADRVFDRFVPVAPAPGSDFRCYRQHAPAAPEPAPLPPSARVRDLTPEEAADALDTGADKRLCGEIWIDAVGTYKYSRICTRAPGHSGRHLAGTGRPGEVVSEAPARASVALDGETHCVDAPAAEPCATCGDLPVACPACAGKERQP